MLSGKRVWLIGASEGLGRSLAMSLASEGCRLVLSARTMSRLQDIGIEGAQLVELDVTDDASVAEAVAAVGDVDIILYCAGAYDPMVAQKWDSARALKVFDVNFLGAMRVLPDVLAGMVARDAGRVVLIGSLSAYYGLPGAIGYSASKAALMHLAENLYVDLKNTGVEVQIINPGFIATRLTDKNTFKMPQIMTPEAAAEHVIKAMKRGRFRTDFPRPFAWLFPIMRGLPDRWVRAMF